MTRIKSIVLLALLVGDYVAMAVHDGPWALLRGVLAIVLYSLYAVQWDKLNKQKKERGNHV